MHTMRSQCCPTIQSNVEKVKVASRRSWSRWRSSTSARMVLRRRWGWPRRIASSKWDKKQDKDKDKNWQRLTKADQDREQQVRLRQKQRHWKKHKGISKDKDKFEDNDEKRSRDEDKKKEKDRERNKDIYRGSQLEDWWAQLRSSCSWSINVAFYRWRSSGRMLSTPCW